MELEGDGPAQKPFATPEPISTHNLRVTPENVVSLAVIFRNCADQLQQVALHADRRMRVDRPWMGDPISEWAREQFNEYFVDGEHAFAKIIQAEHVRHNIMRSAMVAIAQQYGLTEELNAEGFTKLTPPQ
jgi:hypothetical protein